MRIINVYWIWLLIFVFVAGCNNSEEIDPFYKNKNFGDIPILPLIKPLQLGYDKVSKSWHLDLPTTYKNHLSIDSIQQIGVRNHFVYGKINEIKYYIEDFTSETIVFSDKFNTIYLATEPRDPIEGEIRLYPMDSISKLFILPEKWFVINNIDITVNTFTTKEEFKNYLKQNAISYTLYNIDRLDMEFMKTGILPWFPDSVKAKLKK